MTDLPEMLTSIAWDGFHTNGNSSGGFIFYCNCCGRTLYSADGPAAESHGCASEEEAKRRFAAHECDLVIWARNSLRPENVGSARRFLIEAVYMAIMGKQAHAHYWPIDSGQTKEDYALEAWEWLSGTHTMIQGGERYTIAERVAKAETCLSGAVEWEDRHLKDEKRWASEEVSVLSSSALTAIVYEGVGGAGHD